MKNKIWFITNLLLVVASLIFSFICIKEINSLNMLPTWIFSIIVIVFIIINVVNIVFFMTKNLLCKILCIVLSVLILLLSLFGYKNASNITRFLNKSFGNNGVEVTGYSVAVLKSSKYNKLEDLNGKIMGHNSLDEKKEKYTAVVKAKITIEMKSYNDVINMYVDLVNNKIDSMVINEAYLDLLEDEYSDINDRIKIIHNFEIEETIENNEEKVKSLKPVNILISGSDSRSGKILNRTRSDVNMIMTIDPKNHKILLTSIPRDYYVRLHETTGNKDKLTHAGIYGINMTKKTIEDLFNIKIDYTIKVGFKSVVEIVDLIGGIDIDSDATFLSHCGDGGAIRTNVKKGMNHFNGGQALSYARERYAYKEGDNHRVQNQQQVLEAIIAKITKDKSLLSKYDKLLEKFSELYRTDIPSDLIKLIVKDQLSNMKSWKVEKQQVSGTGAKRETYSMPGRSLYVMIPDMSSVKEARNKINKMKEGE